MCPFGLGFTTFRILQLRTLSFNADIDIKSCLSQVRIQDLVKGGPASEAESCQCSRVESHERSKLSAAMV